jgi:geranylgeranyl diphosphate synthase type II
METCSPAQLNELKGLINGNDDNKVERMLQLYRDCKVDEWALELKNRYLNEALQHLEDVAVLSRRKEPLKELASFLISRDH